MLSTGNFQCVSITSLSHLYPINLDSLVISSVSLIRASAAILFYIVVQGNVYVGMF